jgi:hypothetical protein
MFTADYADNTDYEKVGRPAGRRGPGAPNPAPNCRASMSDASQEHIGEIGVIDCRFPNFPRNTRPNCAQYITERPELISHGEKPKKAKTRNKRKSI